MKNIQTTLKMQSVTGLTGFNKHSKTRLEKTTSYQHESNCTQHAQYINTVALTIKH